ncbi:uncharacterized protein L201_006475 [Kwoniella dendrophila CBS 6074]|uniref:Uncharacterized protein n=1 Tax=Kwoniella dendrophila CBS 6074 TaxID=1295534 RepID=A0AAX4K2C1_9TREE
MTSTSDSLYEIPKLGSPSFTPLLLRYILTHPALKGWSINPSLFSILLLAFIVRKGGIVIDVPKKDIDKCERVITCTTKSIFGLKTNHLSIDEYTELEDLIPKICHIPFSSNPSSQSPTPTPISSSNPFLTSTEKHDDKTQKSNEKVDIDVLVLSGLENATSPIKVRLGEILTKKRIKVPIINQYEVQDNVPNDDGECHSIERKFDPLVIWIREEGKEAPSWLIDQFMLGLHLDSDDLDIPPSDLDPVGIIPQSYLCPFTKLLPYVHIHAPLQVHISNLLSAVNSHPSLKTTLTGKSFRSFPEYIKAHRLLFGSFDIPPAFLLNDSSTTSSSTSSSKIEISSNNDSKLGSGGGIGGVDTWANLAGEEPTLTKFNRDQNQSENDVTMDMEYEDIYCTPQNVQGIWKVFVNHRCKKRLEREEIMWLIKGSANKAGLAFEDKNKTNRNRHDVDKILDEILRTV